ncbi:MAG: GGDEF domain-containing protein [Sphingomonadaceae bacterium]|nr:GGDEF domain-containing protein [Sphingomonadaceae bacterium]
MSINVLVLGLAADCWVAPLHPAIWMALALVGFVTIWLATRAFAKGLRRRKAEEIDQFLDHFRNDALTGTLNRSFFLDRMRSEALPGTLLVIDVDHFKAINDRFGHYMGDAALTHLASCMLNGIEDGYVGRLGGEEFAVFLPGLELAAGSAAAEQLRALIECSEFEFDGNRLAMTVSIGVAQHSPEIPIGRTLRTADDNLYAAKKSGRNRIATHSNTVILLQERLDQTQRQALTNG